MAELITPTTRLHRSWLAARDDWGRGVHQDGSGLQPTDDVDSPEGFADWVGRLRAGDDESRLPDGWVPALHWWIVEGDEVLGAIALRLRLNDFLRNAGGHIGYGVRPSARRRGLATFALGAVLAEAARRDIDPVLVTCDDDNTASARTIERHGGVLEDVRDTELGRLRRYWIATG
ncbi:GNAT family N-acetyltransferase [Micromonospora siamensis]|uniref:Predicted acetyltransferase n=1 Tax=Micromonospora siamensis TaxID=299152 RepID=A0A1C5HU02_9ACTN|nr:GNAT family N-acetyltransferase [Micromonospora siamensis]SCG49494.1 Predicted acetyltransferase [Micromonospora siamensis]